MAFLQTSLNQSYFSRMEKCFEKLQLYDKISLKMEKLYELSSLTAQEYEMRNELCSYIQTTLKRYYPRCQVFIFGSSSNGFGTTGCDIDILFLPYPGYFRLGSELDDVKVVLPSLKQVEKGFVHELELLEKGEIFQLLFAKKVFKANFKRFHRVVYIPAKCPILNFVFIWKGFEFFCDLSCRNRLVLSNTELLKFFGLVDTRVGPLVSTLRHWLKCLKHVQGINFSTYAFTLMIMFFLQSVDPPVLPSVDFLMDVAGSSKIVAECKVGYDYDIKKVPKSENKSTSEELLKQFFDYYWNFDFNKSIVCVRTGSALPIKYVEETFQDKCKNFEITAVCIQDPFNLSHNVSRNISHKNNGLRNFKLTFLMASKILENIILSPLKCKFDELFQENNYKDEISSFNSVSSEGSISIIIDLDNDMTLSLENTKGSWFCNFSEAVFQILSKGLLFDCEVIDRMKSSHGHNTSHSKDQYSPYDHFKNCTLINVNSFLSIQCAAYFRTWVTRKTVNAEQQLNTGFSNILEREEYISKCIAADPFLSNSTPFFWFICNCYECKFPQIPCLIIELTPLTQSSDFKHMAKFLSTLIPKTLHELFSV